MNYVENLCFQLQVSQDICRRIANCFVAINMAIAHVAEYYTIVKYDQALTF